MDPAAADLTMADLTPTPPNGQPALPRFRLAPPLWAWVEVEAPYAGLQVEMLLNPPAPLLFDLTAPGGLLRHLPTIIRAWNLDDPAGQPLPADASGVAQLEPDCLSAIWAAYNERYALSKRR